MPGRRIRLPSFSYAPPSVIPFFFFSRSFINMLVPLKLVSLRKDLDLLSGFLPMSFRFMPSNMPSNMCRTHLSPAGCTWNQVKMYVKVDYGDDKLVRAFEYL